jgi:hypothetical protein
MFFLLRCAAPAPRAAGGAAAHAVRIFSLFSPFRLQRPALCGWSAVAQHVALTYAATVVVGLAAHQAGRRDLIRSPTCVLVHTWEGLFP